jgi:phosphoglycerate dehydrogenase-like enzyme
MAADRFIGRPRVVCAAPLHFMPETRALLRRDFALTEAFGDPLDLLARKLRRAQALIPNPGTPFRIDARVLGGARELRLIVTPSTGTDHIDTAYCARRGIKVTGLLSRPRLLGEIHASAEFSFCLLLAIIRGLLPASAAAVRGVWRESEDRFRGIELSGKKASIIGYGRIGRKMGRYLKAFGAEVTVYDPFVRARGGVRQARSFREALRGAGIVCLHAPFNEDTAGMFDRKAFAMMPSGSYFVNTSRGGMVVEEDLVRALSSGRLAAAAVDVIRGEQDSDISKNALVRYARSHPNLIVTPHIAGLTVDSQRKAARFAADEIRKSFKGKPGPP